MRQTRTHWMRGKVRSDKGAPRVPQGPCCGRLDTSHVLLHISRNPTGWTLFYKQGSQLCRLNNSSNSLNQTWIITQVFLTPKFMFVCSGRFCSPHLATWIACRWTAQNSFFPAHSGYHLPSCSLTCIRASLFVLLLSFMSSRQRL